MTLPRFLSPITPAFPPQVFVHQFLLHSSCRTGETLRRRTFSSCQSMPPASWPRRRNWPMIPGGGGKRATVGRPAGKISFEAANVFQIISGVVWSFFKHRKVMFCFFHQLCWCVPFLYRFDPQWLIRAPCFLTAQWWRHKTKHTIPCGRLYPTWIPVDVQWYIHNQL